MEMFARVLAGLSQFPDKIRVFRLYKEGEPMVNPNLVKMINLAKKSNFIERVDTTTNGLLLSPSRNIPLVESGIDQINISVNTVSEMFVKNVRDLFIRSRNTGCAIQVQFIVENHTKVEIDSIINTYSKISDNILPMHLQPNWPGFLDNSLDGAKYGHYGQPLNKKQVCPFIFYQMVINSDGTISACVQDWGHKLIMGRISDGLVKVWGMNHLRKLHLAFEKDKTWICKQCKVLEHGTLDNIDQYADELIKKI
jgi:radical SAM protein with 4Fe4S-binding SPASM domain